MFSQFQEDSRESGTFTKPRTPAGVDQKLSMKGGTRGHAIGTPLIFEAGIPLRRALTARLFTGAYRFSMNEISIPCVLFAVGMRLLR